MKMRRIGVCEERSSGYDKVVAQTEFYQLPARAIEIYDNHSKVILFACRPYAQMSKEDARNAFSGFLYVMGHSRLSRFVQKSLSSRQPKNSAV